MTFLQTPSHLTCKDHSARALSAYYFTAVDSCGQALRSVTRLHKLDFVTDLRAVPRLAFRFHESLLQIIF